MEWNCNSHFLVSALMDLVKAMLLLGCASVCSPFLFCLYGLLKPCVISFKRWELNFLSLLGFPQLDKCRKLIQFAGKSLKGETSSYDGIEACNEVLDGHGHEIGPSLMLECLCIRAALLLKVTQKSLSKNLMFYLLIRSDERRVGKGGRSRWSPYL